VKIADRLIGDGAIVAAFSMDLADVHKGIAPGLLGGVDVSFGDLCAGFGSGDFDAAERRFGFRSGWLLCEIGCWHRAVSSMGCTKGERIDNDRQGGGRGSDEDQFDERD